MTNVLRNSVLRKLEKNPKKSSKKAWHFEKKSTITDTGGWGMYAFEMAVKSICSARLIFESGRQAPIVCTNLHQTFWSVVREGIYKRAHSA